MSKTLRKAVAVLLPAALPMVMFGTEKKEKKPMNIIMFLVDDMGWGDMGYLGNPMVESPNVDAFAESATIFTAGYAAPESSPTRASLLTGKNPARLHITTWISQPVSDKKYSYKGWKMPQESKCVPLSEYLISEALKDNGYATWHIGKWHIGEEDVSPKKQGFETEIAYWPWAWPKSYFSPYKIPTIEDGEDGEYMTDRLTDEAVKLIMSHDGSRPFFLNLWHYGVHAPLHAKKDLISYYEGKGAPPKGKNNANYTAMKHSIDESFGRILQAVDDAGIAENTVIIFYTDNGGVHDHADNGVLRKGKKYMYEGGIRVPLIIRAPDLEKGTTDIPVSCIDFYPTLLHWAGINPSSVPQHLDGLDICSLMRQGRKSYERSLFWHEMGAFGNGPSTAMRKGDYKLHYFYARPEGSRYELYNLRSDIAEEHDLSGEHPDIVESMAKEMKKWLEDNNAQYPTPPENAD